MKKSKGATTPEPADASALAEAFGRWLRHRIEDLGHDLSGQRSGGRSAFAARAGISPSTVTRLLRGEIPTDIRILRTLADALRVPYPEVLVRAGILKPEELAAVQARSTPVERRITPEQAADELGITDPVERRVFVDMTKTLSRAAPQEGEQRAAD